MVTVTVEQQGVGGTAGKQPVTYSAAVRAALAAGVTGSREGVEWVRSKFGLEMRRDQFLNTKSYVLKEDRKKASKGGASGGEKKAKSEPEPRLFSPSFGGQPWPSLPVLEESLLTIKGLVRDLGADRAVRLVELFR